MNSNKKIVSISEIEATKERQKIVPEVSPRTNDWIVNAFNIALAWIDVNLMPVICLALLCGFAVIGFTSRLNHMTDVQKLLLSIGVVALLAVKTGRVTHKKEP